MNFKTTLYLAIGLAVAAGIVWLAGTKQPADRLPPKPPTQLFAEEPVIDEDFGKVVKITCRPHDDEREWQFERDENDDELGRTQWRLVAPLQAKAAGAQVDRIASQLQRMKYQVKHSPGQAGAVSTAQAGLEPPQAVITLTDDENQTVTVEVGRNASERERYVRLAGKPDIYVATPSLDNLLKKKAYEYVEPRLFELQAQHVKKIEITGAQEEEGQPATYTLVRSDTGWTFESPVKAPAVKDKIDQVASGLASLRASGWVAAEVDNLSLYGLGDDALTVRATIEEPPDEPEEPAADTPEPADPEAEPEAPAPPPEPVVREIVLRLARRSPIGEETKVYARRGEERTVATVTKTMADRFSPDMSEWRDMRLTADEVSTADRIELATPQGSATFSKEADRWVEADGATAIDTTTVEELLKQIEDLRAVSFVPFDGEVGAFGLDQPQASLRMNVPGQPEALRIAVGQHTDPQTKRLVYVRRDDSESVAKVRVGDIDKLIREPAQYLDRTVFDIPAAEIAELVVTRPDDILGQRASFTLSRVDGALRMILPAEAPTAEDETSKLAKALGGLVATKVVANAEAAAFDAEAGIITCQITHQPAEITRYTQVPVEEDDEEQQTEGGEDSGDATAEPAESESDDEEAAPKMKLKAEKYTPPSQQYKLQVVKAADRVLAMVDGRPTVYEVDPDLLNLLQAEWHDPGIFDFEESQVVTVSLADGGGQHEFAKVQDRWTLAAEPDLPLDPKAIMDLLLRIKDLKTHRYVAYGVPDLDAFGLATPQQRLEVTLEDQAVIGLIVSGTTCQDDPEGRHYAAVLDSRDVFLLSAAEAKRSAIDLSEFEAAP